MNIKFFLLDINHEVVNGIPEIRLWGIDSQEKRILIRDKSFFPFFYLIPENDAKINEIIERINKEKNLYPEIKNFEVIPKNFFGKPIKAIKVICKNPECVQKYSEALGKINGIKDRAEDDIRFTLHYIITNYLQPCGWHEVKVEKASKPNGINVDEVYDAKSTPIAIDYSKKPSLRVLAFSCIKFSKIGSPKPSKDPIAIVSALNNEGKKYQFIASNFDDKDIILDFIKLIKDYNPDVIVGYGNNKVDWAYLFTRAKVHGLGLKIDRVNGEPHTSLFGHVSITGRANIDLLDFAEEIYEVKIKSIENIAEFFGVKSKKDRTIIEEIDYLEYWNNKRDKLIEYSMENAESILGVYNAIIDFAMQLSALTGLPLDQLFAAAVGFRVDNYIMKEAYRLNELIPRRSEQPYIPYKGALVLKPKPGLHENIAVLDFSSMYPNLMILYNVSPDTLVKDHEKLLNKDVIVIPEVGHKFRKDMIGFYKVILSRLINAREEIKKKISNLSPESFEFKILKEREKAIKIITNACYGYAGWVGARWYMREVAESTAALGRAAIKEVIEIAKKLELKVIYGDTDSIFVENDRNKINKLLEAIKEKLGLEIKTDKIYQRIIFTEAKKRYAGLLLDGSLDVVGLEVVRGDWSEASRIVQEKVLELILKEKTPKKAIEFVRQYIADLNAKKVPLKDLIIWKAISKPIEEYEVRSPHIEVAKKLVKEGWEVSPGDKVGYVIVKGPGKLFEKAKPYIFASIEEIDYEYYINNQILPVASRILSIFNVSESELIGSKQLRLD
ncbi:MAG: DNA polymerase domain-containing protein [Candidatus Bathyarchaeia archaeon]